MMDGGGNTAENIFFITLHRFFNPYYYGCNKSYFNESLFLKKKLQ